MKQVGGAQVSVFTSGFGGAMKSIQIQMKGEDARVLTTLAQRAAAVVAKVPGAVDVGLSTRGQKPELEVQLNRGLAGSLGITVGQVAQSLRPAFAGIDAGDWVDPSGETRDVTVRLAPEARERMTDLAQLPLVAGTGRRRRAIHSAAGPGGDHPPGVGPGADRSPRPRQGRDHPGQRGGTAADPGNPGHPGAARSGSPCRRATRSPTAASPRIRPRSSPGSSPRWASRCC